MKQPEELARELDLVHSQLGTPSGTEDLLLLIGQALAGVLKELQDLNMKADHLLRRTG